MFSSTSGEIPPIRISGVSDEDLSFLTDVVVVNCGGTINMGTSEGKGPAGVVERKLGELQGEMARFGIGIRTIKIFERPPDSSNIGELEWNIIIGELVSVNDRKQSILDKLRSKGVLLEKGGIVVTHGTDTLQVTALMTALEFSVRSMSIPVVFTGSHSPMEVVGSDGIANLRKAIYVAKERFAAKTNLLPAVYVLIGQDVHLASRLTKVRTRPDADGRYFFSFPAPVGRITGDRFHLRIDEGYIRRMLPDSPASSLQGRERQALGIVEHIVLDKFSSVATLDDLRRRSSYYLSEEQLGERRIALVIQGDFSANPQFNQFVSRLESIGASMAVFIGSRKSYNRLKSESKSCKIVLLPKSMTHAKAQAKLRWLLSFRGVEDELENLLNSNFAGEIIDTTELPEWINYETFPDDKIGAEVVIAYPNIHWKVAEDAVNRLRVAKGSRKNLFVYGFGDGHVPTINRALAAVVKDYIEDEYLGLPKFNPQGAMEELVQELGTHLQRCDARHLQTYLFRKYKIVGKRLRSALLSEQAKVIERQEIEHLTRVIDSLVKRSTRKGAIEIRMRNPSNALKNIIQNIRISTVQGEANEFLAGIDVEEWNADLVRLLQNSFSSLIARRLIKDAVMAADKFLLVLGRASDEGIEIKVRTLAVKSRSNTLNYETGNFLMVLGANSDEVQGWDVRYFIPRY